MKGNHPQTYLVQVLGCKVNQYDARQIELLLERCGLEKASAPGEADVVVVHTCGVTAAAAQKSRQTIRRMQREHPRARVLVTGCAAHDELTRVDPAPSARVPAGADWLQRLASQLASLTLPRLVSPDGIETDSFAISTFGDTTRAFLKVQDGCDIGCSFCIVPQLRKEPRDKPIEAAVREAGSLVEAGFREIVVTGVSVGLYGRDSGTSLAKLLKALAQVPDIDRVRLSSLHPGELTDELLEVWASSANIMPHLHLSLQSGSDAILQAMRRGYTAEEYLRAVERAHAALGNPAFTTDVIVGFPGETDAHFEETYAFCRKVGFSQMHVFAYSPRPKTLAASLPNRVGGAVAAARGKRLQALGETLALDFHRRFVGQKIRVLIEHDGDGLSSGYSEHYVPVEFPSREALRKQIVEVTATKASCSGISGMNSL